MKFPVICLKPNDSMIYGFKDENSLKTADKKLTEGGVFNGVTIVDADGNAYLIIESSVLGWATPFLGYSLKKGGRQVKVEFKLEAKGKLSLEDLKQELLGRTRTNPYFKETFAPEEIESRIATSNTIGQLFSFFG